MPRGDVVSIVEAGYRLDLSGTAWLRAVSDAAGTQLFDGLGGMASFFDRRAEDATDIVSTVTNLGADERLVAALRSAFETGSREERDRSLREGGPVLRLSELAQSRLDTNPFYGPLARSIGFSDVVVLRAMNPDGTGAFFAAPIRPRTRRGAEWSERLSLASAHLAAALRLRRSALDASAVLTPDGRALSLEKNAVNARELLRRGAIEMDRARTRRGEINGWRALVDGRWSLVDHFESDGKRFVIAIENAPAAPDPRALAPDERPILHYVAMGHANKLIAYELGIPQGTVATRIASIRRKLGVRSRVELVDRYVTLMQTELARLESGAFVGGARPAVRSEASLTPAEREVALLARRGLTNEEIATERGCAPRTVANLLAATFRKFGVKSRAELATALSP